MIAIRYDARRSFRRPFAALVAAACFLAAGATMVGVSDSGSTRRTFADVVSSNYFSTLGVPLMKGRPFDAEEEKAGADLNVIVTYSFWTRNDQDSRMIGKQLRINGRLFTVIGITPKGFTGTTALFSPEIFLPLRAYDLVINDSTRDKPLDVRKNSALIVVGRLKHGATLQSADAALAVIGSQLEKAFPAENKDQMLLVRPLSRLVVSTNPTDDHSLRVPAVLLLSLAGIVLLIPSLNVANMMMAKGAARRKEIAIRIAVGGNRNRILQQLVTEALLLAIIAGVTGLMMAAGSTTMLIASLARLGLLLAIGMGKLLANLLYDVHGMDPVVLGVTSMMLTSVALFACYLPARRASRVDPMIALRTE